MTPSRPSQPDRGAVILLAHGSARPGANDAVRGLAQSLSERLDADVTAAFLSRGEPNLSAALDAAYARGARRAVVLPLLLSAGRHAARDVPRAVASAAARLPGLKVETLPPLAQQPAFADFLAGLLERFCEAFSAG